MGATPSNCEGLYEDLFKHADAILPRKPIDVHVGHNDGGMPVFPNADLMTGASPVVLAMLKLYLTELWALSWPSDSQTPSMPWADISASPDTYYDTKAFTLPCALVAPDLLTLPNLYLLTLFFIQSSSSSNPFHFRSKSEILERISASKKETNDHGGPAAQYVEGVTGDSIASGIGSSTKNGTAGHDNQHEGNEDHSGDEGDGKWGNNDGGPSNAGDIDDHHASLKVTKLDDIKTTPEPEGGNAAADKPNGGRIVSDPGENTILAKSDNLRVARRGGHRKTRGGRKIRGGRSVGQGTSPATMTTLIENTDSNSTFNPSTLSPVAINTPSHIVTSEPTSSATVTTLAETTDSNGTPDPSTSSAVAIDSSPHAVASEPGAPSVIMTGSPLGDAPIIPARLSRKRKLCLPHVVASEPGALSVITTGSANAPLGDAPIIMMRPSRKRKSPDSIPTLVAAKIPAAVGPDGRPVKRKPGYDYVVVTTK